MKNLMWCALAVAFSALAGSFTSDALAAPLDVYDGFETLDLSKTWDTDRFEPGAVQIQTNIFRSGHGVIFPAN